MTQRRRCSPTFILMARFPLQAHHLSGLVCRLISILSLKTLYPAPLDDDFVSCSSWHPYLGASQAPWTPSSTNGTVHGPFPKGSSIGRILTHMLPTEALQSSLTILCGHRWVCWSFFPNMPPTHQPPCIPFRRPHCDPPLLLRSLYMDLHRPLPVSSQRLPVQSQTWMSSLLRTLPKFQFPLR